MAFFRPWIVGNMAGLVLACTVVGGCESRDARARDAYAEYQAAAAANDMVGAQQGLMKLVSIEDRVAEYWMELAKIQAASGSTGEAYHSLTRAYELDRSNVDLLRALTEFALRGGDPAQAQIYAKELEVVAPGDPWVKLTSGNAALRETRYDEALKAADSVLATSPSDTQATVLKARALLGKKDEGAAVKLLVEQIRTQPSDFLSLQLLANLYELHNDWGRLLPVARRLAELQPANKDHAVSAIEAAFKGGQAAQGREISINVLKAGPGAPLIYQILDVWARNWPSSQRIDEAFKLGLAARDPKEKIPYADFLNRAGRPALAIKLVADFAKYPVTTDNADANAVAAVALGQSGNIAAATKRFDDILAFDAGNAMALRGKSRMRLRTGKAKDAIEDAEKLVTVVPSSTQDRLLLAQVYTASGDQSQAQRTLWDAFRDIPGDELIYRALAGLVQSNPDQRLELRQEFARQTASKISQGLL